MKHTEAPWRVTPFDTVVSQSGTIADCSPVRGAVRWEERRANAQLIATTPALLEALSELLAEVDETFAADASEQGHCRRPDTFGMELARAALGRVL